MPRTVLDELQGVIREEDAVPKEEGEEEEDEEEIEKDDIGQGVSYAKLMSHINQIHPRDLNSDKFSICAHLGSYQNTTFKCDCCCPEKVSELSQEINIGPSMFLMSTKQVTKFFFLMLILNLPVMMFLSQTSGHMDDCVDLPCVFEHVSVGAVGEMDSSCGLLTKDPNKPDEKAGNLTVKCPSQLGKISDVLFIGLAKDTTSTCQKALNTKRKEAADILEDSCYQNMDFVHREASVQMSQYNSTKAFYAEHNLFGETESKNFFKTFAKECIGKNECQLDVGQLSMAQRCQEMYDS